MSQKFLERFIMAVSTLILATVGYDLVRTSVPPKLVRLEAGQKLVDVTWRGLNMVTLVRPMGADEQPVQYRVQSETFWGSPRTTVVQETR